MDGEPLQLVYEDENGKLLCNNEVLDQILRNEEVINRLVAVISITGSERGGKSFLLNYVRRYLASNDPNNRFGLPEQPLNGFPFIGGRQKQTSGILVWSKPFIRMDANENEIAVILMDTQGIFGKSTANDAFILAICSFVSSIQIYNVKSDFLTNSLEQLDIFFRYALNSSPSESIKVFQKLVILVRDWTLDDNFGFEGGNGYLTELIDAPDNNDIARHIESCFSEQVSCYLMSGPGYEVSSPNFNGSLNELREVFVEHLRNFITLLIDDSMMVKKIAGHEVTGERLCQYFKDCFDAIRHNRPLIRTIESHIKLICDGIIREIRGQYELTYREFVGERISQSYMEALQSVDDFTQMRNEMLREAEHEFLRRSQLTDNLYYQHRETLRNELQTVFDGVDESNLKNLCEKSIRALEYYYCKTMIAFANRYFLSYLITSNDELKEKHNQLLSKVTEEFDNLDQDCRQWCSVHLKNELVLSQNKHEKRRKEGWRMVAIAGGITVGGSAAIAAGGAARTAVAEIAAAGTACAAIATARTAAGAGIAVAGISVGAVVGTATGAAVGTAAGAAARTASEAAVGTAAEAAARTAAEAAARTAAEAAARTAVESAIAAARTAAGTAPGTAAEAADGTATGAADGTETGAADGTAAEAADGTATGAADGTVADGTATGAADGTAADGTATGAADGNATGAAEGAFRRAAAEIVRDAADPEKVFLVILKTLLKLLTKYLSVGGQLSHLVRNEGIPTV